ncbi:hypothetical protein DAEQUDRAFT_365354 [Daedalea quercina L-15889]|uniref:Dickkopf N-terminal cysteine-rich domain-containing protein n=1 Tax=Daedalea quercina L-15889 TaxID=1314783 RepID=A0A165P916_9APHY|nr:hypothetical protein DAEQUDRAFT_365354 [Daedalea quercina L-15889]
MLVFRHLYALILGTPLLVFAGNVHEGGACSLSDDRLDPSSHVSLSDCSDTAFCSAASNSSAAAETANALTTPTNATGTCQPRRCRRDEFPFGYDEGQPLPPLCAGGSFCPDDGSGCEPLAGPGRACQLDRDDQCAPPPNWQNLASDWNTNGSICLHSTCMYANVSLGHTCILDDVTYIVEGPNGQQYTNTITRDNCQSPRLYCDRNSTQCVSTNALGAECDADRECKSHNCGASGTCIDPPEMPLHVATWQYGIVALSVLSAMVATILMLVLLHKRSRLKRYREIREYYEEQMRYVGQSRWYVAVIHIGLPACAARWLLCMLRQQKGTTRMRRMTIMMSACCM